MFFNNGQLVQILSFKFVKFLLMYTETEKHSGLRDLYFVNGLSSTVYWMSHFSFDFLMLVVSIIAFFSIFQYVPYLLGMVIPYLAPDFGATHITD